MKNLKTLGLVMVLALALGLGAGCAKKAEVQTSATEDPAAVALNTAVQTITDGIVYFDYDKYDVKRGLRDKNGKGVMCGLTEISEVTSWKTIDGVRTPVPGELRYRGYDVKDSIAN